MKSAKGGMFYIVKLNKNGLSDRINKEVIFGDIHGDPLDHMASLAQRVYHPLVGSKSTSAQWTETIAKEVRDNFETFVANVQITQGHVRGDVFASTQCRRTSRGGDVDEYYQEVRWQG